MLFSGENLISISSLARFVQLAYSLESWDLFESLVQPTMGLLRAKKSEQKHLVELKSLEILEAMLPLNSSKLKKKVTPMVIDDRDSSEALSMKVSTGKILFFFYK